MTGPRTDATPRIASLDGLRAISIALVLIAHLAYMPNGPLPSEATRFFPGPHVLGAVGVDIFFAISGFLITTLLLTERARTGSISLRGFYWRRAVRILPPFLAYLGVLALLDAAGLLTIVRRDWLAALTYTANFVPDVTVPLAHLWSLSVEEHFYLLWPLVLLVAGIDRSGRIALGCLVAQPILRWCFYRYGNGLIDIDYATFTRLDTIACGCLLAILAHRLGHPNGERPGRLASTVALLDRMPRLGFLAGATLLLTSTFVLSHSGKYMIAVRPFVDAFAIGLLLWTASRTPTMGVARVLNWTPLAWCGRLSYSLYLWQQLFLDPTHADRWVCQFPQNILLPFGMAIASYYCIERPCLRLRDRVGGSRATNATTLAPAREPDALPALSQP
jgi:peptidoglycan/LPS O-acetylase OafA/YrhL